LYLPSKEIKKNNPVKKKNTVTRLKPIHSTYDMIMYNSKLQK
jgi:hypothetical protein